MLRSEIRVEAMRLIAEKSTSASYIIADDHNAFIDEGIKEMCLRGFVYVRTKTGTIVSGTARYYFPTDFIRLIGMTGPTNLPIKPIQPDEIGTVYIITGKPLWYYLSQLGGVWFFTLVDTPTTTGGGAGTYTITYNALDVALSADGSSPNFPPEYHHYLVKYDAFKSFQKMKRTDLAMPLYLEFCQGLGIAPIISGDKDANK